MACYSLYEVKKMDIRVLRYFLAVAREENITRAAESMHITQPSLSKQLMELENEVGKQLLIRGKRKVTLTEDGILLRKRAEEIILLVEKTQQEISADSAAISGRISIGGIPDENVLQAAARLRGKYGDVSFEFYSSDATEVMERLDHGSLDFAILLEPIDTVKYDYISLEGNSYWGLVMPAQCELARKCAVEQEDLRSVPLIFHRRIGLQREIEHWSQMSIDEMNIAATYNVLSGDSLAFVRSGLGYLLTSDDHIPEKLGSDICFRPLSPALEIKYALVWKRYSGLSRAAEAFLDEVKIVMEN